jgi:hypothetical protein
LVSRLRDFVGRILIAGTALGIVAAVSLSRLASALLVGVTAHDRAGYGLTCVILASAALTAGYIPASRASRVDPMVARRHE